MQFEETPEEVYMDIKMAADIIGMNYGETLERFAGNEAMLKKYLKLFPADEHYTNLEIAVTALDEKGTLSAAHTLKGLAGNLGLNDIYKSSSAICDAVRADEFHKVAPLFEELTPRYRLAVEVIMQID